MLLDILLHTVSQLCNLVCSSDWVSFPFLHYLPIRQQATTTLDTCRAALQGPANFVKHLQQKTSVMLDCTSCNPKGLIIFVLPFCLWKARMSYYLWLWGTSLIINKLSCNMILDHQNCCMRKAERHTGDWQCSQRDIDGRKPFPTCNIQRVDIGCYQDYVWSINCSLHLLNFWQSIEIGRIVQLGFFFSFPSAV